MIHGEVTHGGIKRVYAERVNGRLQGAVFRFIQGLEAGVNRLDWAPDGSLIAGGAGNPGNWGDPAGEWNRSRLVVNRGRIEHWLNGFKVVEADMHSPEWNSMIAESKFSDWEAFGQQTGGHVILQDHDDPMWFRNIKIRSLDE